jgi:hypothetical protein
LQFAERTLDAPDLVRLLLQPDGLGEKQCVVHCVGRHDVPIGCLK